MVGVSESFYIMDFGEKISPRREGGFFFNVLPLHLEKSEQSSLSINAAKWTRQEAFMGGSRVDLGDRGSVWHGSEKDGRVT